MDHPVKQYHVAVIPYPGWGHVNPLLNLCKQMVIKNPDLLITIIVTEEWLGLIGSSEPVVQIKYATIPNVIPSEHNRGVDLYGFVEAVMTKMAEPVEQVLNRVEPSVRLIMADTYLYWVLEIGNRRNIAVASFWTMPVSMYSMLYHYDLILDSLESISSEDDNYRINNIPGIPSIRLADIPDFFTPNYKVEMRKLLQTMTPMMENAQYHLFRSIYDLEKEAIDVLNSKLSLPTFTIGPCIPYFSLDNTQNQPKSYIEWLNSKPLKSVIYVSLGSVISVSREQMDELAYGLNNSGVNYLWVARGEAERLKEGCGEKGMIVPWCDQLRVLDHYAIGGFLTHCGWNSTLEGAYMGVPMLTFPLFYDQITNSKLVVEDWGIGWRMKDQKSNLIKGDEIARVVKRFMDLDNNERKVLKKKCRDIREISQVAVIGGSADAGLDAFLGEILGI